MGTVQRYNYPRRDKFPPPEIASQYYIGDPQLSHRYNKRPHCLAKETAFTDASSTVRRSREDIVVFA